jgi:hypothetical protein
VVVVIAAFITGLLVGIAGDRLYLFRTGRFFPRRGGEFAAQHIVAKLDRDLHLNASQKTEIERILESHHKKIDAAWNAVRPQVRQEIDATNNEIERVLTPEQLPKFKELRKKVDARRPPRPPGRF